VAELPAPAAPVQEAVTTTRTPVREEPPAAARRPPAPEQRPDPRETEALIYLLRRDPSLRFTETGRELLRLVGAQPVGAEAWQGFAEGVPAHCAEQVARLARRFAENWLSFAEAVER
jgi:hypothetical protein